MLIPAILAPLRHVRAGFTTRAGGVSPEPFASMNMGLSTDDCPDHVEANRRMALGRLGFPSGSLAIAGQVHGADVRTVETAGLHRGCDGLVTATPGLVLGVTAADCGAVLLACPNRNIVGACHAGWRGAVAGVVANTVRAMAVLGANPAHIRAYIAPCISGRSFEIGEEVAAEFPDQVVRRPAGAPRPFVDLPAAILNDLLAAGLVSDHIESSGRCTMEEPDLFFSHRASGGRTGRMMGLIGTFTH